MNNCTLLDVILTNKPQIFKEADVYSPGVSDHVMVIGALIEMLSIILGKLYPLDISRG